MALGCAAFSGWDIHIGSRRRGVGHPPGRVSRSFPLGFCGVSCISHWEASGRWRARSAHRPRSPTISPPALPSSPMPHHASIIHPSNHGTIIAAGGLVGSSAGLVGDLSTPAAVLTMHRGAGSEPGQILRSSGLILRLTTHCSDSPVHFPRDSRGDLVTGTWFSQA